MPIAAYEMPQTGSFVAEPQYAGHGKWGASYVGAPRYASPMPNAEYSMQGFAAPAFSFGHAYASAPAPSAPSYPQYPMPSAASFTFEQSIQQPYQMPQTASFTQMPTTASFTCEQPAQPYSYQQQYAATQSPYGIPQQQSFAAYPQPANYPSLGDMPQFQFYPEGRTSLGADGPSRPIEPMNHAATGPGRANSPMPGRSQSPMPGRSQSLMNHNMPAELSHAKPTGPANHAQAGPVRGNSPMPGRSKSPMNKPNSSTSKRPPAKKTEKKTKGCCSCGV